MSQQLGAHAEKLAEQYLKQQGLRTVTCNYRCRLGEIDLIMDDKHHLVFVEVRKRTSSRFGNAVDSVTRSKQQKIMKTALFYLSKHRLYAAKAVRFDLLCLDGASSQMTWIKNAFGPD